MLYSTPHEPEHRELNFQFFRWILKLNNMHHQAKLRSFDSETWILIMRSGGQGVICWGFE